jgi:predicted metal-dependent HD superfamily phosphohydrolase
MFETSMIGKVEKYITDLYVKNASELICYHSLEHAKEVVDVIHKMCKAMNIEDAETENLIISGWFHDVGYFEKCAGHEEISAQYAERYLSEQSFPEDRIKKIKSYILATKVPTNPQNTYEKIICDADLHHLGTTDIEEKSRLFRTELENRNVCHQTDSEWIENSLKFLDQHSYYTEYAKREFEDQKRLNILQLEKRLKKIKKREQKQIFEQSKLDVQKRRLESKIEEERKAGRGIETMFRNIMRTHVEFSGMADNKANIMITVNTLLLTIIVSVMLRKLDSNPHLIFPTALITITSLTTLIYAILVTRPKVTSGIFTRDDIHNKKANLMFFGNFFNMDLKEFSWGMKSMMDDKEYLYDTMIKDFYYLGQVLGEKYSQLRRCYTIFMYGMILSIIAYAIAFVLSPESTNLSPLIE